MAANFVTIGVDSPLELYTLILGWHQYESIWNTLTSTGLVFLPFLGIIINNFSEPMQSQKSSGAALTSLKRIEIDLISALVVILVAGQPFITLHADQLKFHKVCTLKDGKFTNEETQLSDDISHYKHTSFLETGTQAKVPAWWYAVMAFSSGFSLAARSTLPCMLDFRLHKNDISQAIITNPDLIADITTFRAKCFVPTKSFALITAPKFNDFIGKTFFLQAIDKEPFGMDSIWMGWRPFFAVNSTHFYPGRLTDYPVKRTISNPLNPGVTEPVATCAEFWNGSNNVTSIATGQPIKSIIERVLDDINVCRNSDGSLCAAVAIPIPNSQQMSAEEIKQRQLEFVVREVINNTPEIEEASKRLLNATSPNMYETHTNMNKFGQGSRQVTSETLNVLGALFNLFSLYPMVRSIREGAPAVQAFILMAIYLILPFGLVFSKYSVQFLILGAVGIFTVKFWSYIFYVAFWIDQKLQSAVSLTAGATTPHVFDNFNVVVTTTYFILPTLFISVMAWAGFNVANSIQSAWDKLGGMSSPAGLSGAAGGNAAFRGGMAGVRHFSRYMKNKGS